MSLQKLKSDCEVKKERERERRKAEKVKKKLQILHWPCHIIRSSIIRLLTHPFCSLTVDEVNFSQVKVKSDAWNKCNFSSSCSVAVGKPVTFLTCAHVTKLYPWTTFSTMSVWCVYVCMWFECASRTHRQKGREKWNTHAHARQERTEQNIEHRTHQPHTTRQQTLGCKGFYCLYK